MLKFKRIQTKIFVSFLLIVLIPLVSLSAVFYVIATKFLETQLINHQRQTIELVSDIIQSTLDDAYDITTYISNNETIQELLSQPGSASFTEIQNIMFDYLSNLKRAKTFISFLVIYGDNGFVFRDFDYHFREVVPYEEFKSTSTYIATAAKNGEVHLEYSSAPLFTYGYMYNEVLFGRQIRSLYDKDRKLGMLFMGINRESLRDKIKDIYISRNTSIYVFDDNYHLLAEQEHDKKLTELISDNLDVKERLLHPLDPSVRLLGSNYYVSASIVEPYNWTVVSLSPFSEVREQRRIMLNITVILSLTLLLIVALISAVLSRSITSPIKTLLKSMSNFKRGDFNQKVGVNSQDEIGLLGNKYNEMVAELNELIQKVYISQTNQKMIELKTLQAKIEPHFLYNTLDYIFFNAKLKGDEETAEVAYSLSELFRISLSKGKDYYQIDDEIKLIQAYVRIQHARFPNRFQPVWDIEPEIRSYWTLKLLLQPLVENAILHAFDGTRAGVLKISGALKDDVIEWIVEDNGKGMTEKQVKQLLQSGSAAPMRDTETVGAAAGGRAVTAERMSGAERTGAKPFTGEPAESGGMETAGRESQSEKTHAAGYGIRNVNERLTMLFGPEYRLHIESRPNEGTKVLIRIPKVASEEQWRLLYESHGH